MPYRRRYRPRRRLTRRPRRYSNRRIRRWKQPSSRIALKTHHFKRTFVASAITGATSDVLGAYAFSFNTLPNYTEYTALFDQYRVNKIVVKFVPDHDTSDVNNTASSLSQFHTILDFNDSSAPASLASMFEYDTWKMTRGGRTHVRKWTPSILVGANDSTIAASLPKFKQWISCDQPDLYLYGLKYCLAAQQRAGDINMTPYITFYFSCKSVK